MNLKNAPQPIPYQGSKRSQVPIILRHLPRDTATLWEPFVGSGATTIGAAVAGSAQRFAIGDSLEPHLLKTLGGDDAMREDVIHDPTRAAARHGLDRGLKARIEVFELRHLPEFRATEFGTEG